MLVFKGKMCMQFNESSFTFLWVRLALNQIQSLQNCHLYLQLGLRYIFFEWYNIDLFVFIHTFSYISTVRTNPFILYLDTSLFYIVHGF